MLENWSWLFLSNLVFVNYIGLECLEQPNLTKTVKRSILIFFITLIIYSLFYPINKALEYIKMPFLFPLAYGILIYTLTFMIETIQSRYGYRIVYDLRKLKVLLFYQTLLGGILFYTLMQKTNFSEGIFVIAIQIISYILTLILWKGIYNKIFSEIYSSPKTRYWSLYTSLCIFSLVFSYLNLFINNL